MTSSDRSDSTAAEDERIGRITQQAADLQEDHLLCRTLGHMWQKPDRKVIDSNLIRLQTDCARCDGYRWVELTLRGNVVRRGGRLPEEYVMKATGRLGSSDRDIVRAELVTRLLDEQGE